MSLRRRIVTVSSAVSLVTLSGAFGAVWLAYGTTQERQLDAILMAEAREQAIDASLDADPSARRLAPRSDNAALTTQYAALYDPNGEAIAWTANLDRARPRLPTVRHAPGAPFDMWWNNEHLRAVLTPVPDRRDASLLLLATPRTDLDEDESELAWRMAVAMLVAVVASAVATWWLARGLTRDHEHIATVARRVAAGDLSARVGSGSGDPEIARLGRDVDEMIARLAVLLETQQLFIANASHELRSPVATMLGELSFALRRERDALAYREAIDEALGSARRLKLLTDDLLALARVGGADLVRERIRMSGVARAAARASRAVAERREVELEVTCEDCEVEGHAGDLERLLRNLVENAVRHSPRGGRVRIDALRDGDDIRVVVSDDGPGIQPEVRERIFEPFFRLPADRADASDDGGAGLGLAIGRSIARAHGGELWVDDTAGAGRGARFVVRLPAAGV
jgi:two-component system heavy metal sensor histidine kinase CusS